MKEIGSEFWMEPEVDIEDGEMNPLLQSKGDVKLLMSGRSAILYILHELRDRDQRKVAYLPAYTCPTVIAPFARMGYTLLFYDVNETLQPEWDDSILGEISVLLLCGYFGYPDHDSDVMDRCKQQGVTIIHDVTHTVFSDNGIYEGAHYLACSFRKWFGVPEGGCAVSLMEPFQTPLLDVNHSYLSLRQEAMSLKAEYLQTGEPELKQMFLEQFTEAAQLLIDKFDIHRSDQSSLPIINHYPIAGMKEQRRRNFQYLLQHLKLPPHTRPVFQELLPGVAPLTFPIYSSVRDEIKAHLTSEQIYCSVHWPRSAYIDYAQYPKTNQILNTILSIPCDQRYTETDMERICTVMHKLSSKLHYSY